jgi:hypothetical protein
LGRSSLGGEIQYMPSDLPPFVFYATHELALIARGEAAVVPIDKFTFK